MFNRNNQEKLERKQDRINSGFTFKYFPGVTSIVVNMNYIQRGGQTVHRTLNYYPSSYAFFKVDCLSYDCVNGGFDLTQIINAMVRNHSAVSKGELACDDGGPRPGHSKIVYEIAIEYA